MKHRYLSISVLVIFAALVLALTPATTAAPAQQDTVTLTIWDQFGGDVASPAVDKIVANFEAENPNITIERELVPTEQADETARTALASGVGPDIAYLDITPARDLVTADLILPLDDYAAQYGWTDRFAENALNWTIYKDQLWGLPGETEFVGLWYNKSLFEKEGLEVPQTISQALEFCKVASERGYIPIAPWMTQYGSVFMFLANPITNAVGVDYMEGLLFRHEGTWASPEIVDAINVVQHDMRDAGCFTEDAPAVDHNTAVDMFTTQQSFFLPVGTWMTNSMIAMEQSDGVEIGMMPFFDMETGYPAVFTQGMGSAWYIAKSSKNPDAAAKFLDYFFSPDAVKIFVEEAAYIPPLKLNASDYDIAPMTRWVFDQLAAGGMGYDVDTFAPQEFNQMCFDGMPAIWVGTKTTEQQMQDLQTIWEEKYWGDQQ